MTDNQKRILEMLAEKKISVDEAYRLLTLVDSPSESGEFEKKPESKRSSKYLRVVVEPEKGSEGENKGERVNVRVPMTLIRAGIKLTSLIPSRAVEKMNESLREKGVDVDLQNIKVNDLEELVDALSELEVVVQDGKEKVRVYVE